MKHKMKKKNINMIKKFENFDFSFLDEMEEKYNKAKKI